MDLKEIEKTYLKPCSGKFEAYMIGGSTLYGLNTPESDVDYRGIYTARDKKYIAGFETMDSVVLCPGKEDEIDATFYEIGHYMKLLRKTNTQVMEILFAPEESFIYKSDLFDKIREHRESFIDSEKLKNSLKGYVFSEMRLATGERSGQLGSKRKESVLKYGYSPKNFVQIIRLCSVGIRFFDTGVYMVNVNDDQKLYEYLMDIKTNPQKYTCEELTNVVVERYEKLHKVIDHSKIKFKFDIELASDIILESRA